MPLSKIIFFYDITSFVRVLFFTEIEMNNDVELSRNKY